MNISPDKRNCLVINLSITNLIEQMYNSERVVTVHFHFVNKDTEYKLLNSYA